MISDDDVKLPCGGVRTHTHTHCTQRYSAKLEVFFPVLVLGQYHQRENQ